MTKDFSIFVRTFEESFDVKFHKTEFRNIQEVSHELKKLMREKEALEGASYLKRLRERQD